ncbi:MAG TPA: SMC family ATPase [Ktedonobacteraceae bacterium]|nr:SMC family ATPase [Ktedonobacteraceae bacterium]
MLITRIELENIKSYRQMAVDFRRGTTAISGANGAGKTTIVEAIGYTLFDYLPYNQGQFVREGEKYGRVVVHLIGGDDRTYTVERRCGAGAHWFIYDCESDYRIEQRTDVSDKLHELFGIDRERSLNALFRDALGVPQGTFTAIFLEAAGKRKQTFDALLQIEDYKTAADYLLDAQKVYREQVQTQQGEIQRLQYETRDLENWRTSLTTTRQLHQQQTEQFALGTQHLEQLDAREKELKQREQALRQAKQQYELSENTYNTNSARLADREKELQLARTAQQIVEASQSDYERYLAAEGELKRLRSDAQKRDALLLHKAEHTRTLTKISTNIGHLHVRLKEVAAANRRLLELLPLVDEQIEIEKQRDILMGNVKLYDSLVVEGKRLVQQRDEYLKKQEALQHTITAIEPLQPVADLLQERMEVMAKLQAQVNERGLKLRQMNEKREQVRQKLDERENISTRLRKAESNIAKIEEHRSEAEELPTLRQQHDQYAEQRYRLEGNIEGYLTSRKQSVGGQCPFLHEPCLNIKQRGSASLESYFDNLVNQDRTRLNTISQKQTAAAERMTLVQKYADALARMEQYVMQRDNAAEYLQRLALEITRLEREVAELAEDLEALKSIDQQIARADTERKESHKASEQVNKLDGLRMQVQQLQEQAEQTEEIIQERRRQTKELSGSKEQLQQANAALTALNDPRAQRHAQQGIIKQGPVYEQQLQEEQQKQEQTELQLQAVEQQLAAYTELDMHIGNQEGILQRCHNGHANYVRNEQAAKLLPQRQQAYEVMLSQTGQSQEALRIAEQGFEQAKAAFNEQELQAVSAELTELRGNLKELSGNMQRTQQDIVALEQKITQAEALLLELEAAQKEQATLEELHTMMEQFRKILKEAAPYVLKAMLGDISAEANRIFGEVMGDRSAQLSWQNDYEIILRRGGVDRTFAQLSGGEQMSAALAVRLALLKKLSSLNLAFFDEPTQNMDELRRMNLAEQIRRVRGFEQLVVISHDDTFEQGLDSLVRLQKVNGETRLMTEDEMMVREQERVHAS